MTGHDKKKKVEYFLDAKKKIHVSLKTGKFYNGYIMEVRNEFFIFNDMVLGHVPVWYEEISDDGLEPFRERGI